MSRPLRACCLTAVVMFALLPSAPRLAAPGVDLRPCHVDGFAERVLCGTLAVPENRSSPGGRIIDIHMAVVPALAADPAPDPVVVFAGGPGQSAIDYAPYADGFLADLRRDRDLLLLEQRGAGASSPLDCEPDAGESLVGPVIDAAGVAECLAALEADPRFYTNFHAAEDIEAVRQALGYESFNLWGGSYGTRTALVYLSRYPEHVRTAVLDGPADFELEGPLHMARDAQAALDRLFAACAGEPACAAAFPRLEEQFDALLAALDAGPIETTVAHPRTGAPTAMTLTRKTFVSGLRGFLYTQRQSALIPWMIHRAADGDFGPFAALNLELGGLSTGTMSLGLTFTVLCSEDVPRIDDDEVAARTAASFVGTVEVDSWREICSSWPRAELPAGYWQLPPAPVPVLVLTGGLDPATPTVWGERLAARLPGALHVDVPAGFHNVSSLGCVPDLITDFVVHGRGDALDATCTASVTRPPFIVGRSGATP